MKLVILLKTSPAGLRRRSRLDYTVHRMRVRLLVLPVCGVHYVHWEQNELVTVYALLKIRTWWPTWQRTVSPWKSVQAAIFAWVFIPAWLNIHCRTSMRLAFLSASIR